MNAYTRISSVVHGRREGHQPTEEVCPLARNVRAESGMPWAPSSERDHRATLAHTLRALLPAGREEQVRGGVTS